MSAAQILPGETPQDWSARVLAERDDYTYSRFVAAPVPPPKKRRHVAVTPKREKCSPYWWVDRLGWDAAVELAREFAGDVDVPSTGPEACAPRGQEVAA